MKKFFKYFIVIILLLCLGYLSYKASYAWYSLQFGNEEDKEVIKTGFISIDYIKGNDIIDGKLYPSASKSGGINTTLNIKRNDGSINVLGTIALYVNNIPEVLSTDSLRWEIYENDNVSPSSMGTFNGVSNGDRVVLLDDFLIPTEYVAYTIYIWVDGNRSGNEIQNSTFSAIISASASQTNDVNYR